MAGPDPGPSSLQDNAAHYASVIAGSSPAMTEREDARPLKRNVADDSEVAVALRTALAEVGAD